jgi:ABC-type glutathione transport system ATPase component
MDGSAHAPDASLAAGRARGRGYHRRARGRDDGDSDAPPHDLAAGAGTEGDAAPALRLAGLVKRFGETLAVDHVDLTVPRGSFFGLVGENGAGKTTSLSVAVGLLRPDAGSARVFGVDVRADPVGAKRRIGVLPDNLALPERPTGRELLTCLGRCAAWTAPRSPTGRPSWWRCWSSPRPSGPW